MYAKPKKTQLIALTGGVASGKTVVSNHLLHKGYPVIDADVIAKSVFQNASVKKAVERAFNTTDTRKLREEIFTSEVKRRKLEAILHPKILKRIFERVAAFKKKSTPRFIFIVIPLLFEKKMESRFDAVISVISPVRDQLRRLMLRDRIPRALAKNMLRSQSTTREKLDKSDYILRNNETRDMLKRRVDRLLAKLEGSNAS